MLANKENNRFNDAQTKKRIHEHLSNKDDRISEEDIKNVKTDIVDGDDTGSISTVEKEGLPDNKTSADTDESTERADVIRIETPWNILKE